VVYSVRVTENDTLVASVAFYFVYMLACRVRAGANSVQHNDAIPKNRTGQPQAVVNNVPSVIGNFPFF